MINYKLYKLLQKDLDMNFRFFIVLLLLVSMFTPSSSWADNVTPSEEVSSSLIVRKDNNSDARKIGNFAKSPIDNIYAYGPIFDQVTKIVVERGDHYGSDHYALKVSIEY